MIKMLQFLFLPFVVKTTNYPNPKIESDAQKVQLVISNMRSNANEAQVSETPAAA